MSPNKRPPRLPPEEQAKRRPLPPEVLVGALQDVIHTSPPGRLRAAKSVRTRQLADILFGGPENDVPTPSGEGDD